MQGFGHTGQFWGEQLPHIVVVPRDPGKILRTVQASDFQLWLHSRINQKPTWGSEQNVTGKTVGPKR